MLSHSLRSPARFYSGSGVMEFHLRRGVEVEVPGRSDIIGFADDITLEVYGESIE